VICGLLGRRRKRLDVAVDRYLDVQWCVVATVRGELRGLFLQGWHQAELVEDGGTQPLDELPESGAGLPLHLREL